MKRFFFIGAASAAMASPVAAVTPLAVESIPYAALGDAPLNDADLPVFRLAPGGEAIAVDDGYRVWLYPRATHERLAVTPAATTSTARNPRGEVTTLGMQWSSDGILTAWVNPHDATHPAYQADIKGAWGAASQYLPTPPLDREAVIQRYHVPVDPAYILEVDANGQAAIWAENRGHGTLALMAAATGDKPRQLAEGSWELERFVFDTQATRVFYATSDGIVVQTVPDGKADLCPSPRRSRTSSRRLLRPRSARTVCRLSGDASSLLS